MQTEMEMSRDDKVVAGQRDSAGVSPIAAALIGINLLLFALVQSHNLDFLKGDFKMFYTAAIALRTGHSAELYDRDFYGSLQRQLLPALPSDDVKAYTHPPYELLAFLPLSFLPYKVAAWCWLAISLALGAVCGRLLSSYVAVLGLFPFLAMMLEQQDSALALLMVIGCWLALKKKREALAGFLLGFALFKFQIVLPLAFVLLLWRPGLLKGLAASTVLVSAVSLAMVGPVGLRSYANYISGMAHDSNGGVSTAYKMDPRTNPTLRGLVFEIASGGGETVSPGAGSVIKWLMAVLGVSLLACAWWFVRSSSRPELKFAFAILVAILLSFHLLMHDLLLLALPFALLRGLPSRWLLVPFFVAPLIYLFYPHAQAWLALLLVATCSLFVLPDRQGTPRAAHS
jgi:hypothetical protein